MYVPAPVRKRPVTRLDACIAKHTFTEGKISKRKDIQITCIPIDIRDRESLNRRLQDELRFIFTGNVCQEIQEIYTRYFTRNDISIEERRERTWRHFLAARMAHNLPRISLKANNAVYVLEDDPQKRLARLPTSLQEKASTLIKRLAQHKMEDAAPPGKSISCPSHTTKYMVYPTESRRQIRRLPEAILNKLGSSVPKTLVTIPAADCRKLLDEEGSVLQSRPLSLIYESRSSVPSSFADSDRPSLCPSSSVLAANVFKQYRSMDSFDIATNRTDSPDYTKDEPTQWYEIYKHDIMTVIKGVYQKNL